MEPPTSPRWTFASWTCIAFELVLGAAALVGGIELIRDPTGRTLDLPLSYLERGPFQDYFWPGMFLLVILGVGSVIAILLQLLRSPVAPEASIAVGCAAMIFTAVEVELIAKMTPLHLVVFLIGVIIAVAGFVQWRARHHRGRPWTQRTA